MKSSPSWRGYSLAVVATLKRGKLPATLHNGIQDGFEKHHNELKMLTQPQK